MADSQRSPSGRKLQDLTGQRFGVLVVLRRATPNPKRREQRWVCLCSCGSEKVCSHNNLRSNKNISCRCKSQSRGGRSRTRMYVVWIAMIQRCHDDRRTAYNRYGGRGIVVCQRWRDSFDAFITDMGYPPTESHTIDRVDNNGNYTPENCRWATYAEQARNRRVNRYVTFHGEQLSLAVVAERVGIRYSKLHKRLKRGWTIEEATTEHLHTRPSRHKKLTPVSQ